MKEPKFLKPIFLSVTFAFAFIMIALPLFTIAYEALSEGVRAYFESLSDKNVLKSIKLTLFATFIVVPINTIFGIFIAYSIAKFDFKCKTIITTLLDLPFAISPVVVGLMFVLLFGNQGFLGDFLKAHDIKIVFAVPAILLASAFVTFPFVAKEVLPIMIESGNSEEEAAISLGANGFQTFFKITLPNIKWGLFYGVILTNARAIGEFGAVAVVSGKIIGVTTTMPLYIEILYSEYVYVTAFSIASLLTLLSFITLILKIIIEKAGNRTKYEY